MTSLREVGDMSKEGATVLLIIVLSLSPSLLVFAEGYVVDVVPSLQFELVKKSLHPERYQSSCFCSKCTDIHGA